MLLESEVWRRNYTPYGSFQSQGGPWQAFADEHLDQASGCYLLGKGYRAYSPALMRFCSPDRVSPFHAGGCNAYAYCSADPINRADPSGAASIMKQRRPKPPPTTSPGAAGTWPTQGQILDAVTQHAPTAANIAGAIGSVVGQMEMIQNRISADQPILGRVASTSEFWVNSISVVTAFSSAAEGSGLPRVIVAATGVGAYAELPSRISTLWQNSRSTVDFGVLAAKGVARASGLDVVVSGLERISRPLVNITRVGLRSLYPISLQASNIRNTGSQV